MLLGNGLTHEDVDKEITYLYYKLKFPDSNFEWCEFRRHWIITNNDGSVTSNVMFNCFKSWNSVMRIAEETGVVDGGDNALELMVLACFNKLKELNDEQTRSD